MNEAFEKHWAKSLATLTRPEHVTADSKHWALLAYEAATPQWQDISSAPKDGRSILGYVPEDTCKGNGIGVIQYHPAEGKDIGCWSTEAYYGADPTHWQPLPEPPKQ